MGGDSIARSSRSPKARASAGRRDVMRADTDSLLTGVPSVA